MVFCLHFHHLLHSYTYAVENAAVQLKSTIKLHELSQRSLDGVQFPTTALNVIYII